MSHLSLLRIPLMNLVHEGVVPKHYIAQCQVKEKKVNLFSGIILHSPVFHENILGNFFLLYEKYKNFTSYTYVAQDIIIHLLKDCLWN